MIGETRRALIRTLAALAIVLAGGTAGYLLVEEGWTPLEAFYMTLITITTIGYGEIRPLSDAGRIFTSILIVAGIGTAAAGITQIGSLMVENRIGSLMGRRKMDGRVKRLTGHYIVCGFGPIGMALAAELDRAGIPFAVIDSSDEAVQRAETLGFPVVKGDCTADSALVSAGIRRAAGMAVCIGDFTTNLVAAMAGREVNPALHILARGSDARLEERLVRAGADRVVYPLKLGGQSIAGLIIEHSGGKPGDDAGTEQPGVLGYRVKLYRRYAAGLVENGRDATVASILAKMGAVEAIALRRADGTEIDRPAPDEPVRNGDALALLVRDRPADSAENTPPPAWTEDMCVGVPSIDEEHRMLLTLIARIGEAAAKVHPRSEIAAIFDRLIEYTEEHFRHEEELLAEHGYPGIEEHKGQHRSLTKEVLDLNRDRTAVLPANINGFLTDWLTVHILGSDMLYKEFLARRTTSTDCGEDKA